MYADGAMAQTEKKLDILDAPFLDKATATDIVYSAYLSFWATLSIAFSSSAFFFILLASL